MPSFLALGVVGFMLLAGAGSCVSRGNDTKLGAKIKRQVRLGMSERRVRAILGEPKDYELTDSEGFMMECWFYGSSKSWELCFDNGRGIVERPMRLTSVDHYRSQSR